MPPSTAAQSPKSPQRRRRALALALALGALLAASAVRAQSVRPAPLDRAAIDELSRETLKTLYEKWGTVLLQSGYRVSLTMRGFRTVLPAEFAATRLGEVLTLHPDRQLLVGTSVQSDQLQHSLGVTYEPQWLEAEPDPGGRRDPALDSTIAENLAAADAHEPGKWGAPVAATSYQVELHALGRSVSYRAVLSWLELPAGDNPGEFRLNDPVAGLVVEAASETRRVAPEDVLARELVEHMEAEARQGLAELEKAAGPEQ